MLSEGKAMAPSSAGGEPSYPIGDRDELGKAIHAVGRGGAASSSIRKHIMRQAAKLGASSMIPDTWAADGSLKASVARLGLLRASLAPDTIRADGPLSSDQSPPADRAASPINETREERRKRMERKADESEAMAARTRAYLTGARASARVDRLRSTLAPSTVMAAGISEVGPGPTLGTPGEDGGSRGTTTVAPGSLGRAGKANDGYLPDLSMAGEADGSRAKPVSGPGRIPNAGGPMAGGTDVDGSPRRSVSRGGRLDPDGGGANPVDEEGELGQKTREQRLGEFLLGGAVYV